MAQAAAIARERRRSPTWLLVFLLSAIFHVGGAWLIQELDLLSPKALPEPEDDVVEFVFAPEPEAAEQPRRFTELPEDRADEAPESPDLLSNVDSRARDAAPGGESVGMPRSEGIVDEPQVAMAPLETGGSPERPAPEPESEGIDRVARPHPLAAFQGIRPEVERPPVAEADVSDYEQLSADTPDGNAELEGAISLSTTAWHFAPWMQDFKRAVQGNWYPPYAFKAGVINGWTHVELEVGRDGELLSAVVRGEEGHGSLREASLAALRAAAPFTALPHDFPDETLVINLRMDYLNPALERSRRAGRN